MPDLTTLTANVPNWLSGPVLIGVVIGVIRWAAPIVGRMFDNVNSTVLAGGETLDNVRKDRDDLNERYKESVSSLEKSKEDYEKLLREWADMRGRFELLMYQLRQANEVIISLGGKPISLDSSEVPNGQTH